MMATKTLKDNKKFNNILNKVSGTVFIALGYKLMATHKSFSGKGMILTYNIERLELLKKIPNLWYLLFLVIASE